jgi:hypothetical protein
LIGNFGASEPAVGFSFALDGLAGAISRRNPQSAGRRAEPMQTVNPGDDLVRAFSEARVIRMMDKKVKISER